MMNIEPPPQLLGRGEGNGLELFRHGQHASAGDRFVPVIAASQRCVPQSRFRSILGASRSTLAVTVDEDPVTTNPMHYRTIFENEFVRVLEYSDQPGEARRLMCIRTA